MDDSKHNNSTPPKFDEDPGDELNPDESPVPLDERQEERLTTAAEFSGTLATNEEVASLPPELPPDSMGTKWQSGFNPSRGSHIGQARVINAVYDVLCKVKEKQLETLTYVDVARMIAPGLGIDITKHSHQKRLAADIAKAWSWLQTQDPDIPKLEEKTYRWKEVSLAKLPPRP